MKYILLISMAMLLFSCRKQPEVDVASDFCTPESYQFGSTSGCPTAERIDSTSLFILEGKSSSDTVLLAVQGGPSVSINSDWLNYYEQERAVAYVQQPQTLQGYSENDMNVPDAWSGANVDISEAAQLLDQGVLKYKQQGKTVIVMGGSWGAFIVQQWLSEYENSADKVFILVGRLYAKDLDNEFYPAYPDETVSYLNVQANKDYRLLLDGRDLSNVYYITALFDNSVLKLSAEEINWLDEHGITHYELLGGHSVIEERKGTLLLVDLMFRQ